MATLSDVNPEITDAAEVAELPCSDHHFTIRLSPTPRGARLARLLATEQLRTWDLPLDLDAAALVVAELAANAVTHAGATGRDFGLSLYVIGGALRVEVTDARGDAVPELQLPAPGAESGRGLTLVSQMSDRWGVIAGPSPRKTVWAELDLVRRPAHGNPYAGGGDDNTKGTVERERTLTKPHPAPRDTVG
ncbi:ATP-binding protein [Streptomyces sp. NPDC102467]|uniref:ATP-binding protein n=1 Tax=Streptomyces sp. NPDC102467 TaxID=3366179 RepID=UPI0037F243D8